MAHPPARALALIAMLVPQRRRDSIIGDLLEEYRETQVPRHGVGAADRWFMRQALGFVTAAAALPGTLLGALLTARTLLDVAVPVPDLATRAALTTYIVMGLFVVTGFRLGLVTRRVSGAIATALAATVLGTVVAYVGTFVAMGLAQTFAHPSEGAWAGLREGLDVPAHVIAIIGIACASVGAAAGRAFPRRPFPASS